MASSVNYDFAAAQTLSSALKKAHDQINSFWQLRHDQRNKLLGAEKGGHWEGQRRHDYETRFNSEQRALKSLADEMKHLQTAVENATEQAIAAGNHVR